MKTGVWQSPRVLLMNFLPWWVFLGDEVKLKEKAAGFQSLITEVSAAFLWEQHLSDDSTGCLTSAGPCHQRVTFMAPGSYTWHEDHLAGELQTAKLIKVH